MHADIRAGVHDHVARPDDLRKQVAFSLRVLAILIQRAADVDIVAVEQHQPVPRADEAIRTGACQSVILAPPVNYDVEANFGGLGLGSYQSGEAVPVVTIDSLQLARCDLLKADVEGMELSVLRGAARTIERFHPIVYVENDRVESSPALIEYLLALGYKLYWHLPPLYHPDNFFGNTVNLFGNIVSSNMLGIHSSIQSSITGLTAIERPEDHWLKKI